MFEHFKTLTDFEQYLSTIKKPTWLKRIVVHHTYTPTVGQWSGLNTMQGMYRHYRSLGWTGYPHVFVAPDGIWLMNSLKTQGIHANAANGDSYGIEVVGRYDVVQWQEPIKSLAIGAIATIVKTYKIPLTGIVPHRQFNTLKSCPGRAITMDWVRELVRIQNLQRYKIIVAVANVREDASTNDAIKFQLRNGDIFLSSARKVDKNGHKNSIGEVYQWAQITAIINRDGTIRNETGYVRTDLVSAIA